MANTGSDGNSCSSSSGTSIHYSPSSAAMRSGTRTSGVSRIFCRARLRACVPTSRLSSAILRCGLTCERGFGGAAPGCLPPSGEQAATLPAREA